MDDEIEAFGKLPPHADHFPDIKQMVPSSEWFFVREFMLRASVSDATYDVVARAYRSGYDKVSDGITLMPELEFGTLKLKHPAGIGHDLCYHEGKLSRAACDAWFYRALKDFGHWFRAPFWWLGLRVGGWWAWREHRASERRTAP